MTLLIPWMAFWIAVSINEQVGPVIALLVCAVMPLITYRMKITVYDVITFTVVGALSTGLILTGYVNVWIAVVYLGFGLMWLLSCLTKEPLCAAYVKYNYHGDDALLNPIYISI